jgi:tetratricopeptide (TPR) repeat protein
MKHLVVVVALLALPLAAIAGPKEDAQTHIQKATAAHEAGDFNLALTELEAAYALDAQPDLLYAIGQVHVKLANCPVAITYYEKFLATNPGPEPSTAANDAITSCRTTMAAQPPVEQPVPEQPPPPPPPEPKKFDAIGTTLVGLGIVSTVVGVVMYSSAINDLDDSEQAANYDASQALVDDAQSKRNLSVVFTAVGVAAIGIGAWHYLSFRKKQKENTTTMAVTPTTTGGMVTFGGSF